jgi:glycosyltransferase involved in cell wall biosynthesis
MRILVWQWGRFGAGPRFAFELAGAFSHICGQETLLSLAEGAELLEDKTLLGAVDLPLHTYANAREFVARTLDIRRILRPIVQRLEAERPDATIVTMMGYWDIFLVRRLRRMGVPVAVISHDAEVHPGDRFHLALHLQRHLLRQADGVVTLTDFVARQIEGRINLAGKVHATIPLAAFDYADLDLPLPFLPEAERDRPLRLLLAGRLKRYKGLELLAKALRFLGDVPLSLRVVGSPQDPGAIAALAAFPGVELDLGWKSDRELIAHLDWADATILPYVEASQSGVAPMSFRRARAAIATPVGGLPEQIRHGETGLIAKSLSPEDLAASIRRLAEEGPLARRLGEGALRHATTEISWQALAPRFAEVLGAVARKRTGKGVGG